MKFKKLILSTMISSCFIFSVPVFAQDKPLEKTNITSETVLEENSTGIESRSVSYDHSNYRLVDRPNFPATIELTSSQPYGKAFYANNSPYSAKLIVDDKDPVIVEPYSSGSIVWKKGIFKSSYDITVTATQGNLDGYFSLAKATREAEFQN
ncbi:hypothetical protein B5E58_08135 [Tyzzerella sp. An114]|uniref:hypothetical protein n=1 Tax=Tyzzerella sp. An114 TaxID=1965545 RepID=UPI000B438220|nr:hypothetical protein [Tyzzerella sp. An114]OUQ57913.1 hypothetical protein B5E58_08135 [Tyzzerella sp. An114]